MKKWRVWLKSRPGFFAQYDGKIDVVAETDDDAVERALDRLKSGAFPDRDRSMWIVERVERLWGER